MPKRGDHHTLEARAKLRALWTPERRVKQAAARQGKKCPEHAAAMRGDNNPMKQPEVRKKHLAAMQRPEVRDKISAAHKDKKASLETRAELRAAWTLERRKEKAASQHGDKNPMRQPGIAAKQGTTIRGDKNPMHRPEVKAKHLVAMNRPEVGAKISAANRGKLSGDKHPMWLGGISREPYAWEFNKELKEEVRRRDGYRCQLCSILQAECGGRWGVLSVHHIDYDKKNSDPVNLIALCNRCNARVNKNRKYWTRHFQELAIRRDIAEINGGCSP